MVSFKKYMAGIDKEDDAEDDEKKYLANSRHFEELKEHVAWKDIMTLLGDRLEIIRDSLEDPEKSPNEVMISILRQEAYDIRWFMQLPDITIKYIEEMKVRKDEQTDASSI